MVNGKRGKLVYVANLNETTPDGSYRVKTMTRARLVRDELGLSHRKSRLEALAPPALSQRPVQRPRPPPKPRVWARSL